MDGLPCAFVEGVERGTPRATCVAAFGKARPTRAREPWQRGLDAFISVALAIPAMVIALPLELLAGLFRRGGRYKVQFQVL